jgi:hypothetical protein
MLSVLAIYGLATKRAAGAKVHSVRDIKIFEGAALIDDGADDDVDMLWS